MSEAKNAEAELAFFLHAASGLSRIGSEAIAGLLVRAGYAKREDVLEEAAKVADAEHARYDEVHQSNLEYLAREGRRHSDALSRTETGVRTASTIAADIRSLKGQP